MKSHTNNNKESEQERLNGVSDMGGVGGIGENEPNILVEEEEPTTTTTSGSRKSRKHSSSGDESGAASDNENDAMVGDENDTTLNNNHNSVDNGEGASDGETQEDEADAKLDATTGSSGHNDSQLNNDDDSK